MLLGWIRRGALGGLTFAALGACSSSSSTPTPAPDAAPVCPSSLYASLSASCSGRQVCPYIYSCGPFAATATCACSGDHFSCTDVTGSLIADDAGPRCLPTEAGVAGCPPTELAAQGAFCSETGFSCSYPSACDSTPEYDTCQCASDTDGGSLFRFQCFAACELVPDASLQTDASLADDSPIDAPIAEDAAREASMDATGTGLDDAGLDSSSVDARMTDGPGD